MQIVAQFAVTPCSQTPSGCVLTQCHRPRLTPIQNKIKNHTSLYFNPCVFRHETGRQNTVIYSVSNPTYILVINIKSSATCFGSIGPLSGHIQDTVQLNRNV